MTRGGIPAVEIVTVGDELLLGETVDDNAAWLGRRLAQRGIRVERRATVGDDAETIRSAVADGLERTGTVLCTGGLGPTHDDVTRPAVAALFGRELVRDDAVLASIRARFEARGTPMPPGNQGQALVPRGATVLANPRGTAPGLVLEDEGGRAAVLLPGVPLEMRALVDGEVLPWLERRWAGALRPARHRLLRTTGIAESALAERTREVVEGLRGVTLAFLPAPTGVDLRLTAWADSDERTANATLDAAEGALRERIGSALYGSGGDDLVGVVGVLLRRRGLTLAVAESCTGGLLAKRLTDGAGASDFFAGGVVAYSNEAKVELLGVAEEVLHTDGAVSEAAARAMARGAAQRLGAGTALSVTGVAGPGGGSEAKPVGTVWFGVALPDGVRAMRHHFPGDRQEIRERSAQAALDLLRRALEEQA